MTDIDEQVHEVIGLVRRERGVALTLVGRFARGDEGAYEVIGPDGARLVLKWLPWGREARHAEEHVEPALARLRAVGCPIPRRVAAGRVGGLWFELQEYVAGSPVEHVDGVTLERLIAVVDRERGAGSGTGGDWWDLVLGGLVEDRSPLCRPSVLVGCEPPVAGLLSRLRTSAAAAPLSDRTPDDLVHFDFGPANVLVDGVTLVPIDFDTEDLRAVLAAHGYHSGDRCLVVWEGVTQYLTEDGVRRTFDFLSDQAPGSRLVFTYVVRDFLDGDELYGSESLHRRFVAGRPLWRFGLHPHEVGAFLTERGWHEVEQMGPAEFDARYVRGTGRAVPISPLERTVLAEKR